MMKISIKTESPLKVIQFWNGIFRLTPKEQDVLAALVEVHLTNHTENVCATTNKKEAAKLLGIKDFNTLNNYIKKFRSKGVLQVKGNIYILNALLNPNLDAVQINFIRQS